MSYLHNCIEKLIDVMEKNRINSVSDLENKIGCRVYIQGNNEFVEFLKRASNFGTLETKTFRQGTRGALKIVYWSSFTNKKDTVFQKILQEQLERSTNKEDFSAFDIFQHVPKEAKSVNINKEEKEERTDLTNLVNILRQTKKQLLILSGNLSWINLKNKEADIFKILKELVEKNISIKALCRVDLTGINNINRLLSLNYSGGKELVEIRHTEQPLRALIIDNKLLSIKEIKEPTGRINELNQKIFIFYLIYDKAWIEWMSKIFWNTYSKSIDSNKRLEEMKFLI